jgi:hypothetical protein
MLQHSLRNIQSGALALDKSMASKRNPHLSQTFLISARQFVYKPCHAAAFVLDPLFFALEDGKWKLPHNSLSESERSDVDECVKRIGGEDAENELFDLVVINLPCSQLLNKLYASCAAQEV